ncbi:MAG TPA: hypothetical protein VMT10_09620 [Solirubrobacteraceae bacterium]|nr:hypothetical protein [Solirubrobacteraceae bacterium]
MPIRRGGRPGTAAALAAAMVAAGLVAAPAEAQQPYPDIAVSQMVSSNLVQRGAPVTITMTVTNVGTAPTDAVLDTLPRRVQASIGTNDPYTSVTTTQGSCSTSMDAYARPTPGDPGTPILHCDLGTLGAGVNAVVTAVVQMNLAADFFVFASPPTGPDSNILNDEANDIVNVSAPPVVTGSNKIRLGGLPAGCVSGDLHLTVTAPAAPAPTQVEAYAGIQETADGVPTPWKASVRGRRLTATVPTSKIVVTRYTPGRDRVRFDDPYTIHVVVHRHRAPAIKALITFKICAAPLHGLAI